MPLHGLDQATARPNASRMAADRPDVVFAEHSGLDRLSTGGIEFLVGTHGVERPARLLAPVTHCTMQHRTAEVQVADIFLSYAREDVAQAETLARVLSQQGWSVFWDLRLVPGSSWEDTLETELHASKCIVVLWSRHSIKSKWVRAEAGLALRRDRLIPALIDPCDPPLAYQGIQTAHLESWTGEPDSQELLLLKDGIASAIAATDLATMAAGTVSEAIETTPPVRFGSGSNQRSSSERFARKPAKRFLPGTTVSHPRGRRMAWRIGMIVLLTSAAVLGWYRYYTKPGASARPFQQPVAEDRDKLHQDNERPVELPAATGKSDQQKATVHSTTTAARSRQNCAAMRSEAAALETEEKTLQEHQRSVIEALNRSITANSARLDLATKEEARLQDLLTKALITKRRVDDATTAKTNLESAITDSRQQLLNIEEMIVASEQRIRNARVRVTNACQR
jgi:hypothetical protein